MDLFSLELLLLEQQLLDEEVLVELVLLLLLLVLLCRCRFLPFFSRDCLLCLSLIFSGNIGSRFSSSCIEEQLALVFSPFAVGSGDGDAIAGASSSEVLAKSTITGGSGS